MKEYIDQLGSMTQVVLVDYKNIIYKTVEIYRSNSISDETGSLRNLLKIIQD